MKGLEVLEAEGFPAVTADGLGKRLGVSRGSFYWHFADITAFETALISHWRHLVLGALDTPFAHMPSRERLQRILALSLSSRRRAEIAFRAWATINPRIASALDTVDQRRLAYLTQLMRSAGAPPATAEARARIAYYTYLGHSVARRTSAAEQQAIIDELLRLVLDQPKSGRNSAKTPPTRKGAT